MSWIEGVGDEVTIFFTIFLGLIIILLAWYSTGIREIPFISVIIVQLTRRRVRTQNAEQPQSQGEPAPSTQDVPRETTAPEPGVDQTGVTQRDTEPHPSTRAETNDIENSVENVAETISSNVNEDGENKIGVDSNPISNSANTGEELDRNDLNVQDHLTDTTNTTVQSSPSLDVPALSEQELRQRRLEFFINGSSSKLENSSVDVSQLESSSGKDVSERTPEPATVDPVTVPSDAHTLPTSDSDTGSQQETVTSSTQEQTTQNEPRSSQTNGQSQSIPSTESFEEIRVRIKFFNDEQRLVTCSPTETIGNFRRRHFSTELSESKLVRFIFNGQDLRNDSSTLRSYNIMDNSVLHCLVTQPQPNHQPASDDDDGLDIGMFMFPLFGLLLGIVWYMRFMYRQFFNVTSTLTLCGITFLYLAAFLSTFRRPRHEHLD